MILKDFLINKTIKHHKIPSTFGRGKIIKCEFEYIDSSDIFDSEVHLKCTVNYIAKNGKIKRKKIVEDIEYLEFE